MQFQSTVSDNLNQANAEINNLTVSDEKQPLIKNNKFVLRRQNQQSITKITDISPFIQKLINDLINI